MRKMLRKRVWLTKKTGFTTVACLACLAVLMLIHAPGLACQGKANPGHHVVVKMIDPYTNSTFATITFDEIRDEGSATMEKSRQSHKSPSPYKLQSDPVFYNVATTADYSGDVDLCLNYEALGFSRASALRVSHMEDGAWVTLSARVDKERNLVCARSPSLSHFAIFEDPRLVYGPLFWFRHVAR